MDGFIFGTTIVLVVGMAYFALVVLTPTSSPFSSLERQFRTADSPELQPCPSLQDKATLDLSIVIPAYNESQRLPTMLNDTLDHLTAPSAPPRSCEIIIVDDGSSDDTSAVSLKLAIDHKIKVLDPNRPIEIRVIKLERNRGKGAAVKAGVLSARGTRILMVDADGASEFSDLEKLWIELDTLTGENRKDGLGVVVGSRAHLVGTDAVVKRSAVRNFLMHSFHFILGTFGVGQIRDTQCGFKLFTRTAARAIFPSLHLHRWLFDIELLLLAQYQKIPVGEMPIGWHEVEGSKLSILQDSVGMLKDLIVLRLNYALGRWRIEK